ncbi:MAG: MaoC family dehydratase [Rhodobacter sp.]|nr:MaoC family dehydratase [Rhodobacter sp.]
MSALPGVTTAQAAALAALVAETAGRAPAALPYLVPALLFASAEGQRRLALPAPGPDEILIHDYQAVSTPRPFPLETPLAAVAETRGNDHHIKVTAAGAEAARLTTALRLVARAELAAARPAPFPARLTEALAWSAPLRITQAQTDRYLSLSGDPNPIHRDTALAASLGLPAPIVPGLLLVSLIQPAVEAQSTARVASLKARFMAPLPVSAPLRLALQPRGTARLRAFLATEAYALALADLVLEPSSE